MSRFYEGQGLWCAPQALDIIALFCHMNRSLLTLTHASGMLMSIGLIGLVCHTIGFSCIRPGLIQEKEEPCGSERRSAARF